MPSPIVKRLEKNLKRRLRALLCRLLPHRTTPVPACPQVRKILVFRLDQRLGNGIMLLPLLKAIRHTLPAVELHFLIHHPVAELYRETAGTLVSRLWPYHQQELLSRPWRLAGLIRRLRREKFDLVFTSHNPDNFSLSQALFGRLLRPQALVGFDWQDSNTFYDLAVASSNRQHYAESMVDLWRAFDRTAGCFFGGMQVPAELRQTVSARYSGYAGGVLIWLGATKSKILPGDTFAWLHEQVQQQSSLPIYFAAAPADETHLAAYPEWIRRRTLIWRHSLRETAAFFALSRLFVSGDTGPMHLAAALGVPTLALFIRSNMVQYGYQQEGLHRALEWQDSEAGREAVRAVLRELLPAGEAV